MKIILNLFLLSFIGLFFGCKEDSPVSGNTNAAESYNWSVMDSPATYMSDMSMGDDHSLFIVADSCYRIVEGASEQLHFADANFRPSQVKALNKNYAVFLGYVSGILTLKIYDNGAIRNYTTDLSFYLGYEAKIFIDARDKFYIYGLSWRSYFIFENGKITSHELSAENSPYIMGKINNVLYAITIRTNGSVGDTKVYKILSSGNVEVYSQYTPANNYFYTGNAFIRAYSNNSPYNYSYFKDNSWSNMFTGTDYMLPQVSGPSPNSTIVFYLDAGVYKAKIWDGVSLIEQTNFPQLPSFNNSQFFITEFKNGAFYFYSSGGAGKILKGVIK